MSCAGCGKICYMLYDPNQTTKRDSVADAVYTPDNPTKPRIGYHIRIKIPDECLDPLGGDCPCTKKVEKREKNPI